MTDAKGAGQAADAEVSHDDTYAGALREQARDEKAQKKQRIEAAEAKVKRQKEHLAAAEKELAKAKKENG